MVLWEYFEVHSNPRKIHFLYSPQWRSCLKFIDIVCTLSNLLNEIGLVSKTVRVKKVPGKKSAGKESPGKKITGNKDPREKVAGKKVPKKGYSVKGMPRKSTERG